MRSAVAMQIEGVMMKPVSQAPMPEGILLYRGLAQVAAVVLIADTVNQTFMTDWLLTESLTQHARVVYPDRVLRYQTQADNMALYINRLRHNGYALELIVVPEPDVAARLIQEGYNTLQFTHAAYARPSWRPDYTGGVRPWDELSQQVADQARLRSIDERIEKETANGSQRDLG